MSETKLRSAREVAHAALGDSCGERHERFGHTKECDASATAIEADRAALLDSLRKTVAVNRGQSPVVLAAGVLAWCDAVSAK